MTFIAPSSPYWQFQRCIVRWHISDCTMHLVHHFLPHSPISAVLPHAWYVFSFLVHLEGVASWSTAWSASPIPTAALSKSSIVCTVFFLNWLNSVGGWGGSLLLHSPKMQETQVCHPAAASHCLISDLDKLSDLSATVQRAATSSLLELYPCPGGPPARTTGHCLRAESSCQTRRNGWTIIPWAFFPQRHGNRVCGRENPEVCKKWRNVSNMTLHLYPTNTRSTIGSNHSAEYQGQEPSTKALSTKKEVVMKR